jgi:carboxypeptidase D
MTYRVLTALICLYGILSPRADADPAAEIRQPASIKRQDSKQLRSLYAARIEIDSVTPGGIRAWVNPAEFDWIKERGWQVRWIPPSPEDYWEDPEKSLDKDFTYPLAEYPTYNQLTAELEILSASYPTLCRRVSIGKSVQDRDLWLLKITDNPDLEEDEPEFKYISSMHGNEPVGCVLMLDLIHLLLNSYGTDARITDLVNETEIWIMPLMNPDGYSANPRQRSNAHGVDLNRDFPDRVDDPNNTPIGREPETQAVMNFSGAHSFSLSANFHTGSLLVNYPYDNSFYNEVNEHPDWHTPDDDFFVQSSLAYSSPNAPMYNNPFFPQGITNGIAWYSLSGGMQDWNYVWMGCNEVTIELANIFAPAASTLPTYWANNQESLLAYLEKVHTGIRGTVTDSVTGAPLPASVLILGRDHSIDTDPDQGDYHRLAVPGNYDLAFMAEGYISKQVNGAIVMAGAATRLDIELDPVSAPTGTPTTTPTSAPTPSPSITATPAFDYDVVQDGQVDAKDLLNILEENLIPVRQLFDFAQAWER